MLSWVGRARTLLCLFLFMPFTCKDLQKLTLGPSSAIEPIMPQASWTVQSAISNQESHDGGESPACREAAQSNCLPAMNRLGVMCERGQGVPQDYIEAYKWYARAAEQGYLSAVVNRDNLRPRMTRQQIAKAERLALVDSSSRLATSNRH